MGRVGRVKMWRWIRGRQDKRKSRVTRPKPICRIRNKRKKSKPSESEKPNEANSNETEETDEDETEFHDEKRCFTCRKTFSRMSEDLVHVLCDSCQHVSLLSTLSVFWLCFSGFAGTARRKLRIFRPTTSTLANPAFGRRRKSNLRRMRKFETRSWSCFARTPGALMSSPSPTN